jgi:hypothetical protein
MPYAKILKLNRCSVQNLCTHPGGAICGQFLEGLIIGVPEYLAASALHVFIDFLR